MDYLISFLIGGSICAVVQIVMDKTKLQPGDVMVSLVCLGSFLGFLGLYEPFKEWAKAGATVPIIGFGNTLYQGIVEDVAAKGFIGLFTGGFTAAATGISGALVFGYLASILYNPRMK